MPEKQKGILNKITNLYASLDGYASGPTLTVNKQSNSKSIIGSTLTLLTIALTFYLSWDTISNVLYVEGPKITYDYEQGNANITDINFTNFFMAYSFFTPKSTNIKFSSDTNNYNITSTMTTFLGDCLHDCNNYTFYMGHCNKTLFDSIQLNGLPNISSTNITEIFKEYSFCLPDQFKATLLDDDVSISDFISSFSIYIPDTYNQTQTISLTSSTSSLRNLGIYLIIKFKHIVVPTTTNIPTTTTTSTNSAVPTTTTIPTTSSTMSTTSTTPSTSNTPTPASPSDSKDTTTTNSNSPASDSTDSNNSGSSKDTTTTTPSTDKLTTSGEPTSGFGTTSTTCPECKSYETCTNGKCVTQNTKQAIVATVETFNTYDNPSAANCNIYIK